MLPASTYAAPTLATTPCQWPRRADVRAAPMAALRRRPRRAAPTAEPYRGLRRAEGCAAPTTLTDQQGAERHRAVDGVDGQACARAGCESGDGSDEGGVGGHGGDRRGSEGGSGEGGGGGGGGGWGGDEGAAGIMVPASTAMRGSTGVGLRGPSSRWVWGRSLRRPLAITPGEIRTPSGWFRCLATAPHVLLPGVRRRSAAAR